MEAPPRYRVLGVGISRLTLAEAASWITGCVAEGRGGYVCVTPVHGVVEAMDSPEFAGILNNSLLTTPDGMPLVWLGRREFGERVGRVYGPDLMAELLGGAGPLRHYFYGGDEAVADALVGRLRERFPRLSVAGWETPPWRDLDDAELRALAGRIRESGATVVWVGLGLPRQERFMARMEALLPGVVQIGVGAAFDFLSGRKAQAPRWMQRSGLEWLFRLCAEPRRLGRR